MKRLFFILSVNIACVFVSAQSVNVNHWETVIYYNDTWKYLAGITEPDALWRSLSYNDAAWSEGITNTSNDYRPAPPWFVAPVPFTSSNLPIVKINTSGQTISSDPKITADMEIINNGVPAINFVNDTGNVYTGKIGIEIRGKYSAGLPQKPYGIETRNTSGENLDVPLLDMPAENDWVLLANYNDKSFLRNHLAFDIFRKMGHYAPRVRYCEVVLNDSYQGIYLFGEKIKVDSSRVNISNLKPDENSGNDMTGGYIIKTDYYSSSDSWKSNYSPINYPGASVYFVYHEPASDEITSAQKSYIASFIDGLETALYGNDFKNRTTGYKAWLDIQSFVDYFIISEVSRNVDAYKKSRFFYKGKDSKDGKLYSGPNWDYDWAWRNLTEGCSFNKTDGSGWAYRISDCKPSPVPPSWEVKMMSDTSFANKIHKRYFSLRKTILSETELFYTIDSAATLLYEAQQRHYLKWPILGINAGTPELGDQPDTFEGDIQKFKDWISTRLAWLDANMVGSDYTGEDDKKSVLRVFPNPAIGDLWFETDSTGINRISIYSLTGTLVTDEIVYSKNSTKINISHLSQGVYISKVLLENGKIITVKVIRK